MKGASVSASPAAPRVLLFQPVAATHIETDVLLIRFGVRDCRKLYV